jgi:hypothetical protein
MPFIKPRTRGKEFARLITLLEHENYETLHAYAQFIGEPVDYILNQLVDTALAKDKEYVAWRATHPQACAPKPVVKRSKRTHSLRPVAAQG